VLAVHLHGAFHVTQPAFLAMKTQGYGRIVMTTSAAGLFGNFGQTNYSAAKMGLVGFMNTLELEGAKYNIKVNTVAPLATTRLTQDVLPPDFLDRLKPELVAPIVLYLCSEACNDSGLIVNAGGGFFSRAAMFSAPGIRIGDGHRVPTPEEIHQHWARIDSLEGAQEFPDANAALMAMLTSTPIPNPQSPTSQSSKETGGRGDKVTEELITVQRVFEGMPRMFQADKAAGVDVVFQFRISGSGGGDWSVVVKDKTCVVTAGVHPKPTTTLKMTAEDFLSYVRGQLPAMKAYTSGKLKIEGDLMKSQLIEKLWRF